MSWGDAPDDADRYDEDPRLILAEEDERAARWARFVAWCRGDRPKSDPEYATLLWHIERNMRGDADWYYTAINDEILAFQEWEGWDGVLNAVARAIREERA
jgi:hypothetical protein